MGCGGLAWWFAEGEKTNTAFPALGLSVGKKQVWHVMECNEMERNSGLLLLRVNRKLVNAAQRNAQAGGNGRRKTLSYYQIDLYSGS